MRASTSIQVAAAAVVMAAVAVRTAEAGCDNLTSSRPYCCYISYEQDPFQAWDDPVSCDSYGGFLLSPLPRDQAAVAYFKGQEAKLASMAPTITVAGTGCKLNPIIRRQDLPYSLFRPYAPSAPVMLSGGYTGLVYRGAGQQAVVAKADRPPGGARLVKVFTNVLGEPGAFRGSSPETGTPFAFYPHLKKELAAIEVTQEDLLRLAKISDWFVDVVDTGWITILNQNRSSGWKGALERPLLTVDAGKDCPLSLFIEMTEYAGGDLRKALGGGGGENKLAKLDKTRRLETSYRLLHDVLTGVYGLQAMGLAHLDIKPDNVFLTGADLTTAGAVLGDYGQARSYGLDGKSLEPLYFSYNSPRWAAPETQVRSLYINHRQQLKERADAWPSIAATVETVPSNDNKSGITVVLKAAVDLSAVTLTHCRPEKFGELTFDVLGVDKGTRKITVGFKRFAIVDLAVFELDRPSSFRCYEQAHKDAIAAIDRAATLAQLIQASDDHGLGMAATLRDAPGIMYWEAQAGTPIADNDVYAAGILFAQMLLTGIAGDLSDVDDPRIYSVASGQMTATSLKKLSDLLRSEYGDGAQRVFDSLTAPAGTRWSVYDALREMGGPAKYTSYSARFLARVRAVVSAAKAGAMQSGMPQKNLIVQELDRRVAAIEAGCMKNPAADHPTYAACLYDSLLAFTKLSYALVDGGQHGNYADPWKAGPGNSIQEGFKTVKIRGPWVGLIREAHAYYRDGAVEAMRLAEARKLFVDRFGAQGVTEADIGRGVKVAVIDQWPSGYPVVDAYAKAGERQILVVTGATRGENHADHGAHARAVVRKVAPAAQIVPVSYNTKGADDLKLTLEALSAAGVDVINASQSLDIHTGSSTAIARQLVFKDYVFITKSAGNRGVDLSTDKKWAPAGDCLDFEGVGLFQGFPEDPEPGSLWFLLNAVNGGKQMYECSNVPGAMAKIQKRSAAVPATVVDFGDAFETGTSYSAPYFAGLAVMLVHYAALVAAQKNLKTTPAQLRKLVNSAVIESMKGQGLDPTRFGQGVPDAVKAMAFLDATIK